MSVPHTEEHTEFVERGSFGELYISITVGEVMTQERIQEIGEGLKKYLHSRDERIKQKIEGMMRSKVDVSYEAGWNYALDAVLELFSNTDVR